MTNKTRTAIMILLSKAKKVVGKYIKLWRSSNKDLFCWLDLIGFFEFHRTNNGKAVYEHQVIMFLKAGWRWLEKGVYADNCELDIHHKSKDTHNNDPDNLYYMSDPDHQMLHQIVDGGTGYIGTVETTNPTPLNNQGEPIKDRLRWLCNIAEETLQCLGVSAGVVQILMSLPADLHKRLVSWKKPKSWRLKKVTKKLVEKRLDKLWTKLRALPNT